MHNLVIAKNPFAKLRGLFARPDNTYILIEKCRDIHTFTMNRPIDVVFLDDGYKVVDTYFGLRPRRRVKCKKARHVLECFSQGHQWISEGEKIMPKLVFASKRNICKNNCSKGVACPDCCADKSTRKFLEKEKNESMSSL